VILAVVRTGWMNLRRDRAALMLSFAVPIVFFSIFAGIFGKRSSETPRVTIAIADQDHSERSRRVIAGLQAEKPLRVVIVDGAATAERYVRAGDAPAAIIIPKGFGTTKITFGPGGETSRPKFRIIADSSDPVATQVANGLLQKAVMAAMPEAMMTSGIEAVDRYSGGLTPQQRKTLESNMKVFQEWGQLSGGQANTSLIDIEIADVLGETKQAPMVAFYAAGIGVMFLLFTASNAGGAILEEHESGTLDRILATRVSFNTFLTGKLVYLWTLGVLQLVVMFVWGALVFKVELMKHLDGFLIMTLSAALACAAFGLLIASVARTRAQLGAISTLTVLTLSALGGSMVPRFLMPESMQQIGLALFNTWAIEGFTRVFWREEPLQRLIVPVLVLVGCAAVFFAAALKLTKRFEMS
jgi:ABC-2 type transport system permease protein